MADQVKRKHEKIPQGQIQSSKVARQSKYGTAFHHQFESATLSFREYSMTAIEFRPQCFKQKSTLQLL